MTALRTVVAVHGVSSSGRVLTAGYSREAQRLVNARAAPNHVPFVEANWADIAEAAASDEVANFVQDVAARSLPGLGLWGALPRIYTPAGIYSLIADVFTYHRPNVRDAIQRRVLDQILLARNTGTPREAGVVLLGHSLGSVIALDVIIGLIERGEIGPEIPVEHWPVRGLVTIGTPLGLRLQTVVSALQAYLARYWYLNEFTRPLRVALEYAGRLTGFLDRSTRLRPLVIRPLTEEWTYPWDNLFDSDDPVVNGLVLGPRRDVRLKVDGGYDALGVVDVPVETGRGFAAHVAYYRNPAVADSVLAQARLEQL